LTQPTTSSAAPARRREPKPEWLKIRPPGGETYARLKEQLRARGLHTVCEEARCPNVEECWGGGTATLMLMGDTCTRGCSFCAVKTSRRGAPLDAGEPEKAAESVELMELDYVVLTSVDRDDLPDGGAAHFAASVAAIRERNPGTLVEVLIPDFRGDARSLATLVAARPDVVAQNLETVERLTHPVRDPRAGYRQTLDLLGRVKQLDPGRLTKSSIMLGLGETDDEVRAAMVDLRAEGVDFLTFGQYLAPTLRHHPVDRYVTPAEFDRWREEGEALGFRYVASGPLVRSSYRAGEFAIKAVFEQRALSEKRALFEQRAQLEKRAVSEKRAATEPHDQQAPEREDER
jgi:lipoic acid synthetase